MAKNQPAAKPAASAKSAAVALQSGESASTDIALPISKKLALPEGFKVKRMITVPSLSLKEGQGRLLRLDSAIRVSKVVDKTDKKRDPAKICDATDPTTGEQFIFIVPAVVQSNLERDYPDESYVGKVFAFQNMGKRTDSQRYNDYGIAEVEVEAA